MKHFTKIVDDYEHSGDLQAAIAQVKEKFPQATNFNSWEEIDNEAEADYEEEYGECDEHIYKGYISFDVPDEIADEVRQVFPYGV